jgi:signal transduction histidine kinase/CheY-like chemotaxis protein
MDAPAQVAAAAGSEPADLPAIQRKAAHNLHFTITQSVRNSWSVWPISAFVTLPALNRAPAWLCVGWVLAVGLAFAARARHLRPAMALEAVQAALPLWTRRLNVWTVACAALAATGPLLFYPYLGDVARMYICMLFCCWMAGAMASLGARPRLFAMYAACFTGGLWLGWLRSDTAYLPEILIMLVVYMLVLSGFARSFARQVAASVEIRFINEKLVAELTQAREKAERSSEAKSRFLAVASHDLRQPLHAVTLLNGMLERPQPPERIREISRQMGRSLATLERLFNSVLDFSKIEADKIKPEFAWVPLPALLEQLEQDYALHASQRGLSLRVAPLAFAVYTDAKLLERILRNLLENAFKFTERGSVEVAAEHREGRLVIAVADTGPGIPTNLHEDIFQEYYQTSHDRAGGGLGLGLAIVRRLAGMLGLGVAVMDNAEQGTRFEVTVLPESVRPLAASDAQAPEEPQSQFDLSGYFIVYVDDDAHAREALAMLLADWGCKAVIAPSLAEALRDLEGQGVPDVVLSDYSLQDGSVGTAVIEEIRRRYGPVAGAILTGESSAMQMRLAGELEYPVLGKPVMAHDLRALLEVFKGIG